MTPRINRDTAADPVTTPCVTVKLEIGRRAFYVPMLPNGRIPETEAWARRIAACINACLDETTEDLEAKAKRAEAIGGRKIPK